MLELVTNNLHLAGLILAGLVAVLLGFFIYRKFSSKGTPLADLDQEPMMPQAPPQLEPEQPTPSQDNSAQEEQTE
jgi:hypothetical protein